MATRHLIVLRILGSVRRSDCLSLAAALVFTGAAAWADPPRRVVSLNVCTDQLALMLAAPGQLVSVSSLARDPRSSIYADAAAAIPTNTGKAEDIVLRTPDLVLAGTYTTRATLSMLERLDYTIERFAPINSLDDARANILKMGALLGQEAKAETIVAAFDARLESLQQTTGLNPRVALYYAQGRTSGTETLPGEMLAIAGFNNIAAEKGLPFGGAMPLEELLVSDPDIVLIGRPYGGHSRATELLQHPALKASGKVRTIQNGTAWVCETPALLEAIEELISIRQDWQAKQ